MIISAIFAYLIIQDKNLNYPQGKTESALISIPENINTDILIMGSSHGRMFSRNKNHETVEKILKKQIINIGASAAGVVPEKLFLKYFFYKNNSAKTIFYIIDPFVFSTSKWNEDLYFLAEEPFKLDFFFLTLFSNVSIDVKYNYIKSKFKHDWHEYNASRMPVTTDSLSTPDSSSINSRIKAIYPDGLNLITFKKYDNYLQEIVQIARDHNTQIIFIIPPSLLGKQPLTDELIKSLQNLHTKYGYKYYDFSLSIPNSYYYYNHDHLNNNGIKYFTEKFIIQTIL